MKVKDCMTPDPITVDVKTNHPTAVRLMYEHGIRHLPVVDKKGNLIGLVSQRDVLGAEPSPATTLSSHEIPALLDKLTMDEIMTRPVYAVGAECELSDAAHYMVYKRIGCLPVVEDKKVVGIITQTDMLAALASLLDIAQPHPVTDNDKLLSIGT